MNDRLPLIETCDDCGACCMQTPVPPFQPGEEVARDVPDHLLQLVKDRVAADEHFDLLPCVWFDESTRRCRHYDFRPQACREFQIGSDLCHISRSDIGIYR